MSKSKGTLLTLWEGDCYNEDILVISLKLVSKIQNSQVSKCHNIALLIWRVEEYNIEKVKKIERIEEIRDLERIKKMKKMEKGIREIN